MKIVTAKFTDCIDLRAAFGQQFRIGRDEAYQADYGERARLDDPWLCIIPCQHGHVFPYGGTTLGASTNRQGGIAKRILALSCCTLYQDGTDGITVLFDLADFGEVAAIMRPRRRRRLTTAQRLAAAERLSKYRFSAAAHDDPAA
jgi:hypothetical protein